MKYKTGYMIRNNLGEYSTGGQTPTFKVGVGKIWSQIGHVKNHIHQFKRMDEIERMVKEGWEIVECKLVVERVTSIEDLFKDVK